MKLGISGITGRVGQLILSELIDHKDHYPRIELTAGLAKDTGGMPRDMQVPVFTTDAIEDFVKKCDYIIDFSRPETTLALAKHAAGKGCKIVIGTTGLSNDQEDALKKHAENTAIVYAANMSVGVNVLLALVEKAASVLDADWDIEISEAHHKYKVDAPSGTAIALGHAAAKGRDVNLDDVRIDDRTSITTQRKRGDIGFAVQRGGDVVGEHSVTFYNHGERITLDHIATDRRLFARGALKAVHWVKNKDKGLFSMHEVLELTSI